MKNVLLSFLTLSLFSNVALADDYSLQCLTLLKENGFSLSGGVIEACENARSKSGIDCVRIITKRMERITHAALASAARCKNERSVAAMEILTKTYSSFSNGSIEIASKIKKEKQLNCFTKYVLVYDGQITDQLLETCL